MTEGIVFGGYLLSKEQFVPIFSKWYENRKNDFKKELQENIIDNIEEMIIQTTRISKSTGLEKATTKKVKDKYNAKMIYMAWEDLTKNYFGNGSVSILAGAKFGNDSYQWTKIIEEKNVVNENGIYIQKKGLVELEKQLQNMDTIFAASELQDMINYHFDNLVHALNTYNLSRDDAEALHILLKYRKSKLERPGFTGSTYNKIIFGGQSNAAGKQLDAYMNHIGDEHPQVFGLLSSGSVTPVAIKSLNEKMNENFIKKFENEREKTQTWLLDSLNTASWLTGGDVIVVDDKGAVLYNIQLKTTNKGKTFEVAMTSLLKFAKAMVKLIEEDASPNELANVMYDNLKTSSANEISNTNAFFEKKVYQFVEKNLKLPKNTIKIDLFS